MAIRDNAEALRDRAYRIWEREGRPSGREHEHWAQAARELNEEAEAIGILEAEDIEKSEQEDVERLEAMLARNAWTSMQAEREALRPAA